MADPMLERTTLKAARRKAQLPRRVLLGVCALLALLGIKALLRPAPAPVIQQVKAAAPAPARSTAAGFAEAFTRAYLSYDSARPEDHAVRLAPFLGAGVDVDAGLPTPSQGRQEVEWTATIEEVDTDPDRVAVTVAAVVDGDPDVRYLAVPVTFTGDGRLAVADYPAIVGPPRLDADLAGREGDDIDDAEISDVVERALTNYLARQVDNLRADLVDGTELRVPKDELTLDDVVSVQWAGRARGRVSAVVVARDAGDVAYTLRYELRMVREGRWYVAEINPPMASRKESPQ